MSFSLPHCRTDVFRVWLLRHIDECRAHSTLVTPSGEAFGSIAWNQALLVEGWSQNEAKPEVVSCRLSYEPTSSFGVSHRQPFNPPHTGFFSAARAPLRAHARVCCTTCEDKKQEDRRNGLGWRKRTWFGSDFTLGRPPAPVLLLIESGLITSGLLKDWVRPRGQVPGLSDDSGAP